MSIGIHIWTEKKRKIIWLLEVWVYLIYTFYERIEKSLLSSTNYIISDILYETNPENISIGIGVTHAHDVYAESIRQEVRTQSPIIKKLRIFAISTSSIISI
jgi:hypothetical protein